MRPASVPLILLLVSSQVNAADRGSANAETLVRLEVHAAADCTSAPDLIARVRARTPRIRFADRARDVEVAARFTETRRGQVAGELVLSREGKAAPARRLVASSCAEAADGVALILAITLDPTYAAQEANGESAEPRNAASSSSPSPGNGESGAAHEAPRAGQSAAQPTAEISSPASPEPSNATESRPGTSPHSPAHAARDPGEPAGGRRWQWSFFAVGQLSSGPAPELMPGVAGHAVIDAPDSTVWSPAFVVGVLHAWSAELVEEGGTASFELDAALLDACPLRFLGASWGVRGCAATLIGRLSARGTATRNPAGRIRRPFVSTGVSAVSNLELGSALGVWARAGVGVNSIRDEFEFTPTVFHSVGSVSAFGSFGLGVRLP